MYIYIYIQIYIYTFIIFASLIHSLNIYPFVFYSKLKEERKKSDAMRIAEITRHYEVWNILQRR